MVAAATSTPTGLLVLDPRFEILEITTAALVVFYIVYSLLEEVHWVYARSIHNVTHCNLNTSKDG